LPSITQYADEAALENYGIGDKTLEDIDAGPTPVAAALEAASRLADGYLSDGDGYPYTLPLTAISVDLTMNVAWIAAYILMGSIGYSPEAGQDNIFKQRYDDAIKWLTRVRAGDVTPGGVVGTPVDPGVAVVGRASVISGTSRGFSSRGEGGIPVVVFDLPYVRGGFVGD
jgi:phage gp36-like protein